MTTPKFSGDLDVVSRTLWGEARGEGLTGMFAVACVIRNRVERPSWWGAGWQGVCLKPWQFSCWNQGDPNYRKLVGLSEYGPELRDARMVAMEMMNGKFPDITHGATHYCTLKVNPKWAETAELRATIGNHRFFRE